MKQRKPDIKSLIERAGRFAQKISRYNLAIFISFTALLYIFVLFRINSLNNEQPSVDAVNNQVKAAQIPHIDQSVVKQLESLRDNSVSVQTLFNQARDNPFEE